MMGRTFTSTREGAARLVPATQRLRNMTISDLARMLIIPSHVPLALLMIQSPVIATAHALLVLSLGVWWAAISTNLARVAYVGAYLTGAEILWRMTGARVFWEYGKYAMIVVFALALIRAGRLKGPILAFLYFFLLLPSLVVPMASVGSAAMRNQVSFYLSGPLALMVSAWFFWRLRLTTSELHSLFRSLIAPVLGVAAISLGWIVNATTLTFSNNSNFVTSGGFGPNQVSAALGLGALMAFLWAMTGSISRGGRTILFALALFLLTQSALTFSRGGLYMAIGGAIPATFFFIRDRRLRLQLVSGIAALFLIFNFVLLPQLDEFTKGALSKRLTNTKLTGRDKLALADLKAFEENPLFGVGPGQAVTYYQKYSSAASAHTEFSRLLAEHGVFGLLALLTLLGMAVLNFRQAKSPPGKALVVSMVAWSFIFMTAAAMRLVAPSFCFGLTAASLSPDDESHQKQ
ncbi:MAG TPA: O-antigen ligase family protein [Blastocatellia bacterium]|nr:O-antigen ligase family protein [Blastocatellia bacterium]